MKKILAAIALTLFISVPVVAHEIDYCEGDFDYDADCDGTDASVFKLDFGRSAFDDPCPPPKPAPSLVPKTGQTVCYDEIGNTISCIGTGQDGEYQNGVTWPNPRFVDNLDGTITDNLTGLIWLKDANCFGQKPWDQALLDCNGLADGQCGLIDGTSVGDWRLPNYRELLSLVDAENYNPALPTGQPFINVHSIYNWSSTAYGGNSSFWTVDMWDGLVHARYRSNSHYFWPVRGGH